MPTLISSAVFPVVTKAAAQVAASTIVLPAIGFPVGQGRLVHPTLGTFDYEYKPDEWVNIDGDIIVPPTWTATKTLGGMATALWLGSISDIVCEERWKALGGAAMPITQFRMLLAIWTTPVDPSTGYVQWFPNYTTSLGYNVIPVDLVAGSAGSSSIARIAGAGYGVSVFDDVSNYVDGYGEPFGWVDMPVTLFLKIVSKIASTLPGGGSGGTGGGGTGGTSTGVNNANGADTFNGSVALDNLIWYSLWSNFQLPTGVTLPSDAVIIGMYSVIQCAYSAPDSGANPVAVWGTNFDPSQLGFLNSNSVHNFGIDPGTNNMALTELFSAPSQGYPSIGSALSALVGQQIATRVSANALEAGTYELSVQSVGIAICFTSGLVSVGANETQMPRPSRVDPSQHIVWALPFTASSGAQNQGTGTNGSANASPASYVGH